MFSSYVRESTWDQTRRGWSTAAGFAMQATALALLITLPLFHPNEMVRLMLSPPFIPLIAPQAPVPAGPPLHERSSSELRTDERIVAPPRVPDSIANVDDHGVPPIPQFVGTGGVPGATGRDPGGLINGLDMAPVGPAPAPTAAPPRPSVLMDGFLLHRVQPEYPILARQMRLQGPVHLRAIISRQGAIENLQVISGQPLLVRAARQTVEQWRYRPFVLNGQPIEVETEITINFTLGGS